MQIEIENNEVTTTHAATPALQTLAPVHQKFYRQSLYIAAIERYFGLRGLICYSEVKHEGVIDYAFRHVETDERILVFSRLDADVVEVHEKLKAKHRVIIDVTGWELDLEAWRPVDDDYPYVPDELEYPRDEEFVMMSKDTLFG